MKRVFPLVAAATLLSGCASLFSGGPPSDPLDRLRYDLNSLLSDSLFIPTRTSIKIVAIESNEVLYERDSKMLMRPASNMKLLTSATALQVLGKDYRFKTTVYADSVELDSTALGDVYLKGFGDPDLVTADLDTFAYELKSAGITRILGNVVADNSYFDDLYWGNGWMWDDEPDPDEMYVSALSVNKNCVKVTVQPGTSAGDSLRVTIDPPTGYVSLINDGKTTKDTVLHPLKVSRLFKERLNTITVEGELLADTSIKREYNISVWKPELYAAYLFWESLQKVGVRVIGLPGVGIASADANERLSHFRRMDSMVVNLNKVSDNLSAENTLKTIAATRYGIRGSAASGIYVVRDFLSSIGIDTTTFLMVDGSGVSHYNLLTTDMMVRLLVAMAHRSDLFPLYYDSLPIAGIDGTLKGRMKATLAEGNLRAKTGSIGGVSSLSGYVHTRDGEILVVSLMMQNFILSSNRYRFVQDEIGALLANFSRKKVYPGVPVTGYH